MSMQLRRTVVALLGGAAMLVAAAWYDADVAPTLQQAQGATFDPNQPGISLPMGLGYITVAVGVMLLALLARRADSRPVDVAYALAGAFCAVLEAILWAGVGGVFGAPPVDPLAVLGVAMCFIGLSDLAMRRRRAAGAPTSPSIG